MTAAVKFGASLRMYARPADTPFSEFVAIAQAAEGLGFDGLFSNDHFFLPGDYTASMSDAGDAARPYYLESWTSLAAVAARTSRIRLGHQVTPLCLRHPAFVAKMAANIDLISEGRFILGVGVGWHGDEYKAYGVPFDTDFRTRYEKAVEAIRVIRGLWTSEGPYSFHGKHYQLQEAQFWPKPVQRPGPPIWMGGAGKTTRALIARELDGWAPIASQNDVDLVPEKYAECLQEIGAAAKAAGRDAGSISPGFNTHIVIDRDRKLARERAGVLMKRRNWSKLLLDQVIARRLLIVGNPEDCVAKLKDYVAAGARYLTLGVAPISDPERTIRSLELIAREVIPACRA